jgi:hypothetical protein
MVDSLVTVSVITLAMAAPAKSAMTEKRILILGIGVFRLCGGGGLFEREWGFAEEL